jgi:hypothetical protein
MSDAVDEYRFTDFGLCREDDPVGPVPLNGTPDVVWISGPCPDGTRAVGCRTPVLFVGHSVPGTHEKAGECGYTEFGPCRADDPYCSDTLFTFHDTVSGYSHLRILDAAAGATHALFFQAGSAWWVKDLGSEHGTRLNGAAIKKVPVRFTAGSRIQLGRYFATVLEAITAPVEHQPPLLQLKVSNND